MFQRIRDPLHNIIEFGDNELDRALWNAMQTRPFQRLRRVRQLGFSEYVYPGATHSRFLHSIGVYHTAKRIINVIDTQKGTPSESRSRVALAAALLHDLGHGPFSHAFEEVGAQLGLKNSHHEKVTELLIKDSAISEALRPLGSGFANDVAQLIANPYSDTYGAAISSQFDADRLDYLRRDQLMTGTDHGAIDFHWLMGNLKVKSVNWGEDEEQVGTVETLALSDKAFRAAEGFVLGLFHLYPTVYFHKTTRCAEKIYSSLLLTIAHFVKDGRISDIGLQKNNAIIKFFENPNDIENITGLDDSVVWGSLHQLSQSKSPRIRDLSSALTERKLYRCINYREILRHKFDTNDEGQALLDAACSRAAEKLSELLTDLDSNDSVDIPALLLDAGKREPYKRKQVSAGPLNQILIERPHSDQCDDLRDISDEVRSVRPFKFNRVYVQKDDKKLGAKIEKMIEEEALKCTI